jgi:hypothetical protein
MTKLAPRPIWAIRLPPLASNQPRPHDTPMVNGYYKSNQDSGSLQLFPRARGLWTPSIMSDYQLLGKVQSREKKCESIPRTFREVQESTGRSRGMAAKLDLAPREVWVWVSTGTCIQVCKLTTPTSR